MLPSRFPQESYSLTVKLYGTQKIWSIKLVLTTSRYNENRDFFLFISSLPLYRTVIGFPTVCFWSTDLWRFNYFRYIACLLVCIYGIETVTFCSTVYTVPTNVRKVYYNFFFLFLSNFWIQFLFASFFENVKRKSCQILEK